MLPNIVNQYARGDTIHQQYFYVAKHSLIDYLLEEVKWSLAFLQIHNYLCKIYPKQLKYSPKLIIASPLAQNYIMTR